MGRKTNRMHLLVKRQCFAQAGKGSAACRVMFPQQSLETKRCENIRERDSRWTTYSIPATCTVLNPRTPKSPCFSVRVAKSNVGGLISFVHWGECTSGYINIELWGQGVVPDRKGLNMSSIYGCTVIITIFNLIYNTSMVGGVKQLVSSLKTYATKVGRAGTPCEVAARGSATSTCWDALGDGEPVDLAWVLPWPLVWRFPALASSWCRLQAWSEVLGGQCAPGNGQATWSWESESTLRWCAFPK